MSDAERFSYEVAVIGMAGRFPGARNTGEFWRNLRDGVESITFFSDDELREAGEDPSALGDPNYVRAAGALDDVEMFDAAFFGFTPREAETTDPQHRIFLECAWEALESAGYDPARVEGRTGVYAGEGTSTYLLRNIYDNPGMLEKLGMFQTIIGNDRDFLSTQVSYKLDLRGPSLSVQTACSTSLVAVHMACQSLLNRECDMALAGGVSIRVPQKRGYVYQDGSILSPDGHCCAFDASAQGTVSGSGAGVVVLKRMTDALADGDTILAVIKGSAINNDGSQKVGYTAPSVDGQAEVIEEALAVSGVEAESISYIEAHGTGTPLGDPIEIKALTQVFRDSTDRKGFCAIGSVKTNLGHLDAAAGVTGLIKTVLALRHKQIPPSLHYNEPNPNIDFVGSPFFVNTQLVDWRADGGPRRAGVSSFGIGGTNAHVVLEEAPETEESETSEGPQLLVLSARTATALDAATTNLTEFLKQNPEANLAGIAYTSQVGRRAFEHRRALVCHDTRDAVNALDPLDPQRILTHACGTGDMPVVFMFSGQGSQYVNMGAELYRSQPVFREQVDLCSQILESHLGLDLRELLYPGNGVSEEDAAARLRQTAITQPAVFLVEYALARMWMDWGVQPEAMIGHSIGEFVAACLAGVLSLEDALRLVAARGRLMQRTPEGAMLAVPLPEDEVRALLRESLSLAAVNAPRLSVVSGPTEAVNRLERELTAKGITARRLHTSHALHSSMMDPMLEAFGDEVRKATLNAPQLPYISSVTGRWITAEEATGPGYWMRHARQPVRFADGVEELLKEPARVFLEVGAGQTLTSLVKQQGERAAGRVVLSSLRHPQERQSDLEFTLNVTARLWLAGVGVDWRQMHGEAKRRRVTLPTYPFERARYWIDPPTDATRFQADALARKADIADWFYAPSWKRSVRAEAALTESAGEDARRVVFAGADGLGEEVARLLRERGEDVFTVTVGDEFARLEGGAYTVNPRRRDDYDALFKDLRTQKKTPTDIIHLWNVAADDAANVSLQSFDDSQQLGFNSLLFIAQALGDQLLTENVRFTVVASGVQEVSGEESLRPERATLMGPIRVIPLEYPNFACRIVDVIAPAPGTAQAQRLAANIVAELSDDSTNPVVAYRGNHRWVQVFEPLRLEGGAREGRRLREGGVYMFTGGASTLDLVLARRLAEKVRAKIVLTGRTGLPRREEWDQLLAEHDENDALASRVRRIKELEEAGGEVLVAESDVTDERAVRAVVEQALAQFGTVNGAVHSATTTGGGMMRVKKPEAAAEVLAPKVKGTLALVAALEGVGLDFLVLSASTLALTGAFGQVDFSAANAFLNAYAHDHTARRGVFTVAVDWSISEWETWQESLLASTPQLMAQFEEARAAFGLKIEDGVEAFERILSTNQPQVVVSTQDFQELIEQQNASAGSSLLDEFGEGRAPEAMHDRAALNVEYIAPQSEIERGLAGIWQEVFGIRQVGIHDNFFELGGNSLVAIQLVSQVRKAFDVEVPMSSLFESPTVAGLSAVVEKSRLEAEELEEIERMLREIEGMSADELNASIEQELHTRQEEV